MHSDPLPDMDEAILVNMLANDITCAPSLRYMYASHVETSDVFAPLRRLTAEQKEANHGNNMWPVTPTDAPSSLAKKAAATSNRKKKEKNMRDHMVWLCWSPGNGKRLVPWNTGPMYAHTTID